MMRTRTLTLKPQTAVNRKISIPEYYHAASGASFRTLEHPRVIVMAIEGEGYVSAERWEAALKHAADDNPGARMRLRGHRQNARWSTDHGQYPNIRFIENCDWDGLSEKGAEFVDATPLDLENGPIAELIIASGIKSFIIFRVNHAAMDGMGTLHFLREIFRSLRSERLLGSNAEFSDVDLMRSVMQHPWQGENKGTPIPLTGGARGTEIGETWRLLKIPLVGKKNVAGRIAELAALYARRFSEGCVRIAVPVSLRRHLPELASTMNFTGLMHIDLLPDETAEDFRRKTRKALGEKKDIVYHPIMEWLRYLPLSWVDYLTGRRRSNYLQRRLVETAIITNFGEIHLKEFCCNDFLAVNFINIPIPGNSYISLHSSGETTNIIIGMPNIYASEGRIDEFCNFIINSVE